MPSFRLARVLRLQAQLRQLRQYEADELAARLEVIERERLALAAARDRLAVEEARAAAAGLLAAAALHLGREYDAALADREARAAGLAGEVRAALAAKRDELIHERREERKYLRLEETHRQRTAEEDARVAARLLDELALQAHARLREGSDHGGR